MSEQFRAAIEAAGLIPPLEIIPGKLHRFPGRGKSNGNTAGWLKLFPDEQGGVFGDWIDESSFEWHARNGKDASPVEREAFRRQVALAKQEREAEQERLQAEARRVASQRWATSPRASSDFTYLTRKKIKPHGVRLHDGNLIVPLRDTEGTTHSLQTISPDGEKRFLSGGRVAGCYFAIGDMSCALILCVVEGFATGATIHEATGYPVAVAFNCGNLKAVAEALRKKFPDVRIVIGGDNDFRTEGNPGMVKANDAARSVGGDALFPVFGVDRPDTATDFNDLAALNGLEAVRNQIESAVKRFDENDGAPLPTKSAPCTPSAQYPEPIPLPKLPPVPDFPIELLPEPLAACIIDAAERARFRVDFAAVAVMAALGSVIGRKLGIRLKQRDDWTEYANVWGVLVGPPSALKSPAMREAMRPFKALQVAADEEHEALHAEYAAQIEAYKLCKEAKKKVAVKALSKDPNANIDLGEDLTPDKPVARTFWTSDATAERLGESLAENPNGLLVVRDELSSLLMTLEDERGATARGLYLSGWSGKEGYRFDRIMRGTTTLPKFALSVVGGIQPGPLARYVRGAFSGERADGLLQRFQLIVWPDSESFKYVDRFPNGNARKGAAALFERANAFDPQTVGTRDEFGDDPPFVRLSAQAQILFEDWYTRFMREQRANESSGGESAPVSAHFGKYPGLVGKLALILHVADDPCSNEVSEQTLLKALAWIDYLIPHARRVYHAVEHPETGAAELLLARLQRGDLPPRFKSWELSRKCWHGLVDREAVKKACRLLLDYGWLVEVESGGGQGIGRPADPVYSISPAVKVGQR